MITQVAEPLQQGYQQGEVKSTKARTALPSEDAASARRASCFSISRERPQAGVMAGNYFLSHKQTCLLFSAPNREFGPINTEFLLIDPNMEW